jgi:hypothetical protein
LVSNPWKAVVAAHEALHEALTLSASDSSQKSRLPKELLQTCIKPVLLNLREHTKLSVPLLRGLSRLLSLLSSWFNKTLGEKLLDHLNKWTDPAAIKAQKIWAPGEEPCVAAAIIDLFSLLPYASQFVEPLVKTTIKLEAYLPGFNSHFVGSPYRKPLARYLNKHCQYTVGFFFQRLKAPIYSELFQHIIRLEECDALRAYLGGRQCSVMMLNVCFERPLAIIRSEKTISSGTASSSPTPDLFLIHGIHSESTPAVHVESILKHEMEVKRKKLQALQQSFQKAKENTQKVALGPAEEESKRQYKLAKAALDKGTRDLTDAKQRFAAEFAKSGNKLESSGNAPGPPTVRQMNTESLELQLQGFILVKALIAKNAKYLQEHNDVVRALRWLWRSKGRYLRLQHEDMVSPRYHEESKILVTFLMKYAEAFPDDVDVLFELIRIFLQPSTTDFSFVRFFLAETVRSLQLVQKKQLIQRFFTLLAGESTEETKALSIQLLLLPLLASETKPALACRKLRDDSAEKHNMLTGTSQGEAQPLVDAPMIQKFTKEVLFDKGHPTNSGEKLKVELLRVTNSMLELAPLLMKEYQKDIIRFCWTLIKSEDAICKAWAYVVVCHVISLFDTQAKHVLQVYSALLRSHQQEGKSLVRKALALLVPALNTRLPADDFRKSIEVTSRIMFEDGSVPQLAHIWHTIVDNPDAFFAERQSFVRYMVNSLNRLGLPPNSLPENRALAVSIVDLLIDWDEGRKTSLELGAAEPINLPEKRKRAEIDFAPAKRSKGTFGEKVPVELEGALLDKSMVETIANFLVRLMILLADQKVQANCLNLNVRTIKTFRRVLSRWKSPIIRPVYFEKVATLCAEEAALEISTEHTPSKGSKSPRSVSMKATVSPSESKKNDSPKLVTTEMLSACLDIFTALMDEVVQNDFLIENVSLLKTILGSCFRHVSQSDGYQMYSKLHAFVVGLYKTSGANIQVSRTLLPFMNSLLEGLIAKPEDSNCSSSVSEQSRPSESRKEKTEATDGSLYDSQSLQFALAMIEDVCQLRNECFAVFSSALLSLGSRLVKKHLASTSAKKRQGSPQTHQSVSAAIPQMYPTPTQGILDSVGAEDPIPSLPGAAVKSNSSFSKQGSSAKHATSPGSPLRGLVVVVRLFETSNVPSTLSEDRNVLFHIVSSILDNSDDVHLLMAAFKVAARWLLEGWALTLSERRIFLWKIASCDILNGLPDIESQPLADLIAHFVIKYLQDGPVLLSGGPVLEKTDDDTVQQGSFSEEAIMRRALVACLLNANCEIRNELLSLHASLLLGVEHQSVVSPKMEAYGEPEKVLWSLLQSDYEGLGGRFWIVVFVEVLLQCCTWTVFLHQSGKADDRQSCHAWLPSPNWDTVADLSEANVKEIISTFYANVTQRKAPSSGLESGCIPSLQVLAHGSTSCCRDLFISLLSAAWSELPNNDTRLKFVPVLERLLAQPFHSQCLRQTKSKELGQAPLNVVQVFLEAVRALEPRPLLDTHLLVTVAQNYNCWFQVLNVLEDQYTILAANKGHAVPEQLSHDTLCAMRQCYRLLGDEETWTSLAFESCTVPDSKCALTIDLYGLVNDASDAFRQIVHRYEADESRFLKASDFELQMWEERWIELQRELCQQEVVAEYGKVSGSPRLQLESSWKSQDWDGVRQHVASPTLVAAMEAGDPTVKICEAMVFVANGKLSDVENSHAQAAQLCLYKWQQLPRISRGSPSHTPLLHTFNRLVEIRESSQICVETSNHSSGRTLPDLKNLLK